MLWFAILVLSIATAYLIGRPLLRAEPPPSEALPADDGRRAIYADQLAAIEAELARGVIGADDAEAARIEVSRRLLAQEAAVTKPAKVAELSSGLRTAIVAAMPLLALALYAVLGSPTLPGHPHTAGQTAARQPAAPGAPDIEALIVQVEERLREVPQDGRGWEAIAPVYLRVQRYDDAKNAFQRSIAINGETPKRLTGFAEAAIRAADGMVTDEARAAFEKVLKAEPDQIEARFWLALAREQRGELKQAAEDYRAILATATAETPWRGAVEERLAAVAGDTPIAPATKGPSEKDMAAAQEMTPQARQQMIAGMVEGLHQKLKANGRDADGWQRLLRAYGVIGDRPKALDALAEARRALAEDKQGLAALDALAREMGLGS